MLLSATCMTLILSADALFLWCLSSSGIDFFLQFILLLIIHLTLCVLTTRLLMFFLPIKEGEFSAKSPEAARWQAQAVVGLLSYIYFEPFVPFFLSHDSLLLGHWIVGDRCKIGRVVVGKKAMIGAKSLVFPGAVINEGAAIGAMSLLTSDQEIPAKELWVGIPAKKIQKKIVNPIRRTNEILKLRSGGFSFIAKRCRPIKVHIMDRVQQL